MLTLTRIIFALTVIPAALLFILFLYILIVFKCLFTLSSEPLRKVNTRLDKLHKNLKHSMTGISKEIPLRNTSGYTDSAVPDLGLRSQLRV